MSDTVTTAHHDARPWHALDVDDVCARLDVDPDQGLRPDDVDRRRAEHGGNVIEESEETPWWKLLAEQFARGNENNQHQAGTFTDRFGDARTFLGSGEVSSYAIFNLTGRYRFARNWEVFARIDNLFDTEYETAAILAENPFDAAGQFQTDPDDWGRETFFAPGAPRAAWVGVKFAIDRQPRR